MQEKPELTEEQQGLLEQYFRLARSRPYEQGQPLPIPFEVVDRYCQRFGPHGTDEFDRFLTLVEVMDSAFLNRVRQERQ